jgi:hypothetical protein
MNEQKDAGHLVGSAHWDSSHFSPKNSGTVPTKNSGTVPGFLIGEMTAIFWVIRGEIECDSTQKRRAYTNSGEFFHASARTPCAEPLRPLKRNASVLLNTPSRPPNQTFI